MKELEQGDRADLGAKYKDTIFGIGGIATAQCTYLTGCDHVLLEWVDKGEIKSQWFDIIRIEPAARPRKKKVKKKTEVQRGRRSGGPASHPPSPGPGETMA